MNEEEYGIELKLITNKFKTQMANITNSIKTWASRTKENATISPNVQSTPATIRIRELEREIVNLKKEMADTEVGTKAFNEYALAIDSATAELNQLKKELNQVNKTSKNADLKKNFEEATKSGRKFIMSLFSLRSIWSLISRASNSYIQTNDALNNKIQLTSQIFGSMLAPAIKKVVDLSQYAVIILAKVIQLFTGYNALANLTTISLNKTSKASKKLSKSLAGFDTITNLGDKTNGVSDNISSSVEALNDFQEKINKVEKIFNKYEDEIKLATIALGIMFGASMLNKISKFIGGGAGVGATGISGVLGTLMLLTATVWSVKLAYESVSNVIEEYNSLRNTLKAIEEGNESANNKIIETTNNLHKQALSGKFTSEQMKKYGQYLYDNIQRNNQMNNSLDEQKNLWGLLTGEWKSACAQQDQNNETTVAMTQYLMELYDAGNLNVELEDEYVEALKQSIDILDKKNSFLDDNSDAYQENKKKIEQMQTSLKKLTGEDYEAKATIKADTSDFKKKMKNLLNSTGGKILKTVLNITLPKSNIITSWLNSFDVGTNYVPNDQLAVVHKGEQIIPKKWNPATSGIYNSNDEVVYKLDTLIRVLENKSFDAKISAEDIGRTSVNYINEKSRIMGRSVIK